MLAKAYKINPNEDYTSLWRLYWKKSKIDKVPSPSPVSSKLVVPNNLSIIKIYHHEIWRSKDLWKLSKDLL